MNNGTQKQTDFYDDQGNKTGSGKLKKAFNVFPEKGYMLNLNMNQVVCYQHMHLAKMDFDDAELGKIYRMSSYIYAKTNVIYVTNENGRKVPANENDILEMIGKDKRRRKDFLTKLIKESIRYFIRLCVGCRPQVIRQHGDFAGQLFRNRN